MENENRENNRPYKINIGDVIEVKRNDVLWKGQNLTFYKTYIQHGKEQYYKNLKFRRGVEVEDGTFIRILDFFETPRHKDKFNDEWSIMIMDYEIAENTDEAVAQYKKQINDNYNIVVDEDEPLF